MNSYLLRQVLNLPLVISTWNHTNLKSLLSYISIWNLEAGSIMVHMLYHRFRPIKSGFLHFSMFSFSCSLLFSCLFGCFLVGRWVHEKGHWASICILSYMLMCSINNHKASDFVLGRRFVHSYMTAA